MSPRKIIRRCLLSFAAIFALVSFSFVLIHLVPGSPVDIILGERASSVDQMELEKQLGLNLPLWKQYVHYIAGAFQLDFGLSVYDQAPVWDHIRKAFPPTLSLTLSALILAVLWGIPLGVLSALYRKTFLDHFSSVLSVCGFCLPVFFLAPILIWIFSIKFPWLPVSETGGWKHYVLPSFSLALPLGSALLQMGRASLLEIIHRDYIRTAHSKGLSRFHVYFKHALKPALAPLITILGLQGAALLSGTVIVETIFDWPGLGLLLFQSISRRDYPVIQACVLVIALIYLVINALADGAYTFVHKKEDQ